MCTRPPWTSRYNHNWCSVITLLNTGHVCVSALNFEREKRSSCFSIRMWRPISSFKLWQGGAEAVFYSSLIRRPATLRTQTKETRVHVVRRSLNISVQSFEDVPLRVHTETRNMRHVWLSPPKRFKDEKAWLAASSFDFIHIMDGFSKLEIKKLASVFCILFYCVVWFLKQSSVIFGCTKSVRSHWGQQGRPTWLDRIACWVGC